MKITQEGIQNLGFTFCLKHEESGDDCTYNLPSNKRKGWVYCLVHHPSTGQVAVSHHKDINNFTIKDIERVFLVHHVDTIDELKLHLETHGVINNLTKKEIVLQRLREVTNNKDASWDLRYFHHATHDVINNSILKVMEEIVSSDDFEKKIEEKLIECTLKKIELESIYENLNQ
jgi:hypothetical protein